jgi:hypothetical protein
VFHKICATWVPEQFTGKHNIWQSAKVYWTAIITKVLLFWDTVLLKTRHASTHCTLESKPQSIEWKHSTSPTKKKFKTQPSLGRVMLTLFLGRTRANFGTLPRETHKSQQCPLQWYGSEPAETSYSDQTLRTTVKRCHNVAW